MPKEIDDSAKENNILPEEIEFSRREIRVLRDIAREIREKRENLNYVLALHFAYHNFRGIHKTIRYTPAMEAGLTKHIWELKDLLNVKVSI